MPLLFDGVLKRSLSTSLKGFWGRERGGRSALISQPYTAITPPKKEKKKKIRRDKALRLDGSNLPYSPGV